MRKLMVLLAVLALSSCAADGGLATHGQPVDKAVTLKATCDGLQKLDVAFQAFAKARPGVIDANGMSVEGAIMATTTPICTPPYATNIDTAINTAITATIQISTLLATWQT